MKKICVIIILFLPLSRVWSQEQLSVGRKAAEYYQRYEYAKAAALYKRLAGKKKVSILTLERLADSYRKMNAYEDAANWYSKLLTRPDAQPEDGLYYGDMLKSMGRYEEAKNAYAQYAQKYNQAAQVANRQAGCDSAIQWIAAPGKDNISNVARLNTSSSDWGATYYPKGIVFMSDSLRNGILHPASHINKNVYGRTNRPYYKLYVADSNNYGNVYINDLSAAFNQYRYHIGPVAFDEGYNTAYFTVTDPARRIAVHKEKFKPGIIIYGNRRLELFISRRDSSGKWSQAVAFPYNRPDQYSLGHAAVSADGRTLYFAADMPGGQGGTDIWYSEKQADGNWGTPQNGGAVINTPEDEAFPTIAADGNLYYSSKGLPGMGGYDIFKTNGALAQWSKPVNLRYPVNSAGDDFYLISRNNGTGFLSSNRKGGKGSDDIYAWASPEEQRIPLLPVPGLQIPFEGNVCPPFRAACIYLYNVQRGIGWCLAVEADGKVRIKLERETDYVIRIHGAGGRVDSVKFSTRGLTGSDVLQKEICPQNTLRQGTVFILNNLHYDYDKSEIRPDAALVLDSLAAILREHPTMRIELSAHTDSRGSAKYNLLLSQRRAAAAVAYLVKQGIARNRMVAKGYGSRHLLNNCTKSVKCSDAEHEVNRRTAVKILRE
ncbi:OmpA family protein [Chitinophaga nivalis]|uniref:OmpA family protein n=1 Tax=Chitinophaga nivalis TaxID=2991709 RepID=A0ABT3IN79_9BACT|nr:OmpA family protein [Chitinophaga nivalis]MCW3464947.1 OmpA family protein [Chitinophaga nivalis]MCW3485361.1 OmpA family protein [Chitinophaga nivalis]